MSKQAIDLLRSLSLITNDGAIANLAAIPKPELASKLRYYFETRSRVCDDELKAIRSLQGDDAALLSSISTDNSARDLCPKLLVQRFLVIDDPVLEFATPLQPIAHAAQSALGLNPDNVDVEVLGWKLRTIAEASALISAGLVHVLPISLLHRSGNNIPIVASETSYRELVPENAREFIRDAAVVRGLERVHGGLAVAPGPNVARKPAIAINFSNDEPTRTGNLFQLQPIAADGTNSDEFRVAVGNWDENPVEERQYAIWVQESINRAAGMRLSRVAKEIHLAEKLRVPYLTESQFEAELLSRSGASSEITDRSLAVAFLEANRGLLNLSDPTLLSQLRIENEHRFQCFRAALLHSARELKDVPLDRFADRAKELFLREIEPQIREINSLTEQLRTSLAQGSLLVSNALLMGMLTGPSLPVVSILGFAVSGIIGEALPAIGDYQRGKNRPEFIWNKLRS